MMRIIFFLLIMMSSARADDYTHWKEPELGPISAAGTVIDVENYHCVVKGPRSIECLNVGRVCIERQKRDDEKLARRFGCAIQGEKNYPCPKDDPIEPDVGSCWPMEIGGW